MTLVTLQCFDFVSRAFSGGPSMAIGDSSTLLYQGRTLAEWFDVEPMSTASAVGVDLAKGDLPLFAAHIAVATGIEDKVLQSGYPVASIGEADAVGHLLQENKVNYTQPGLADEIFVWKQRPCETRLEYLMHIFASQPPPLILRIKPQTLSFLNDDFFLNYQNYL